MTDKKAPETVTLSMQDYALLKGAAKIGADCFMDHGPQIAVIADTLYKATDDLRKAFNQFRALLGKKGGAVSEETSGEFLKRLGIDGDLWAKEFLKCQTIAMTDLDTVRGWFCNAIMAGYDQGRFKSESERDKLREALGVAKEALGKCRDLPMPLFIDGVMVSNEALARIKEIEK